MAYTDPVKMLSDISEGFRNIANNLKKIRMPKKSTAFKQLHAEVVALTKQNEVFSAQMAQLGKEFRLLEQRAASYETELEELKAATDKQTRSSKTNNTTLNKQVKTFGVLAKSASYLKQQLQWYPAKTVTFAILNSMKAIPKLTADYGAALSKVTSIARLSTSSLANLDAEIKKVSSSTKFYITDIAEVTKQLAQAGFRDTELVSALDPVAKLAQATSADIKAAANLEATVIRAFKKDASEFTQVSDVISNAVINTRLSLEDLNTAFSYVGSAAAQTGVSLEETVTLLGILRNSGLQASTAATGLRMALLQLTAPTRKGQKVLDAAGLSADELNIADKGIKQVLKSVTDLSKVQLINIFGARSANAILVFKNMSIEAIDTLQSLIETSGTTALMAKEQLYTLATTWDLLINKLQVSAVGIGQTFEEAIIINIRATIEGIQVINKTLEKLTGTTRTLQKVFAGLFGVLASFVAIKAVTTAFGFLVGTFRTLITIGKSIVDMFGFAALALEGLSIGAATLGETLLALAGPVGLIVGGLAAIVGTTWYSSVQEAEELKLNIEKSSVAMGKLVGDVTQLAIKLAEIENLDLTETTKQAIVKPLQDKAVQQANDYFERLRAQNKNNQRILNVINKEEQQLVKQIKETTDPKKLNEIVQNIGVNLSKYFKNVRVILQKDLEYLLNVDGDIGYIKKLKDALAFIKNFTQKTADDTVKARTKASNQIFAAFVNSQQFQQYKNQIKDFDKELQKPSIAMIQAYESEIATARKGLRLVGNLLNDYYNGKINLTTQQEEDYNKMQADFFTTIEKYENLTSMKFSEIESEANKMGQRSAKLMLIQYMDGYKKALKNAKNDSDRNEIRAEWINNLKSDLGAKLKSEFSKSGLALSADQVQKLVTYILDNTVKNFAEATSSYSISKKLSDALKRSKDELSSAKINLSTIDQLVKYNLATQDEAKTAFNTYLSKEKQWIEDTYKIEVDKLGKDIANINKNARIKLLDVKLIQRKEKVANTFVSTTMKQIEVLKILSNYTEKTGIARIEVDNMLIAVLAKRREELAKLGDRSIETTLRLAKLDKVIKALAQDITNLTLQPFKDELSELNTQIDDMTSIRDFELDSGNFLEVYKLNGKIYKLYLDQIELLKGQALWKLTIGEIDNKTYETQIAKIEKMAEQYKRSFSPIGQAIKELQDLLSGSFSTFFQDAISGTKKLGDAFKDLGRSIVDNLTQAFSDALSKIMVKWVTEVAAMAFMHSGGIVGQTATIKKPVDPAVFIGAPRLHNGLKADEFPAILQKGETVLPKNTTVVQPQPTAPNVEVNVINQVGDAEVQQSGPRYDGEKYVLDILLKAKRKGNPQMKQILGTA